jgi:hypothetical protein
VFGNAVAAALETYIRATVARIAVTPESGERLRERPEVMSCRWSAIRSRFFTRLSERQSRYCTSGTRRGGHGWAEMGNDRLVSGLNIEMYERATRQ